MKNSIIPENYEEWRHCIIVDCGLELSPNYISQRISSLKDENDYYTQQFVKLYGRDYLQKVLSWFMKAQELST